LAHEFLGGADKIFHVMVYLQGVPDAVDGVFLPARLEIAAKNLQNAEALQLF
jgi:hypothetical protein